MAYIYNDEDNAPMEESCLNVFPESGKPEPPKACCWFCENYNGDYCTRDWNNNDADYCIPERDERNPDDLCDHYQWNGEYERGDD